MLSKLAGTLFGAVLIGSVVTAEVGPPLVGCSVKGNISINTGERIYHVPGQEYYSDTRIDLLHGERWFCSEQAARKAGWRILPSTSIVGDMDSGASINSVRELLGQLPAGIALVSEGRDEFERWLDVKPSSGKHCSLHLRFPRQYFGTYYLGFGNGLRSDELSVEEFPPAMVVRAILEGRVDETVWYRAGKVAKAKGVIGLQNGERLYDTNLPLLPFGLGEPHKITYASYFDTTD